MLLELEKIEKINKFVHDHGGDFPIYKILIANNGMAAVKETRSIRQWSFKTFGDDRAIKIAVMASENDIRSNSEFLRMADQVICVPGGTNNHNYANVDLIVEVALECKADAVWPGWGHASENPSLPEKLALVKERKIRFIGPSASAMNALGDKISSMLISQTAQVPTIAWSGSGLIIQRGGNGENDELILEIDSDLYRQACITTVDEGLIRAQKIGYPLMIKASEGGGGKGIRKVLTCDDFPSLFHQVEREVPGSPIFLMKLATLARHLEIQVIGDHYGNVITLYGRDCSIQRRHQKIIEEAPITIAPQSIQQEMELATIRLAKMVGYYSCGTVEYLYSPSDNSFTFLELNPRVQVEHPTTEMITGVNIPATQLMISMGIPLDQIESIRHLYKLDSDEKGEEIKEENGENGKIKGKEEGKCEKSQNSMENDKNRGKGLTFSLDRRRPPIGHVVAARITAENPDNGFKPDGGKLSMLTFKGLQNVWGYFSINHMSSLHEFADSQFGHVFSHGATRAEALSQMVLALKTIAMRAEFRNTSEYLSKMLESKDIRDNLSINTSWLDEIIGNDSIKTVKPDSMIVVVCTAAALGYSMMTLRHAQCIKALEKRQIPSNQELSMNFDAKFVYNHHVYNVLLSVSAPDIFTLYLNSSVLNVHFKSLTDDSLLLDIDDSNYVVHCKETSHSIITVINGQTCTIEREQDPTILKSPSSGKLTRYLVENGSLVHKGTNVAEIEVMKMYMSLCILESGIITLLKQPGSSIQVGEPIATLKLASGTSVKNRPSPYNQSFHLKNKNEDGEGGGGGGEALKPHRRFAKTLKSINNLMTLGFEEINHDRNVDALLKVISDESLIFWRIFEQVSNLAGRIRTEKLEQIKEIVKMGIKRNSLKLKTEIEIPEKRREEDEQTYSSSLSSLSTLDLIDKLFLITKNASLDYNSILEILKDYKNGQFQFQLKVIVGILQQFITVEQYFHNETTNEAVLSRLLGKYGSKDLNIILNFFLCNSRLENKIIFINMLLEKFVKKYPESLKDELFFQTIKSLTLFNGNSYAKITRKTREILLYSQVPSLDILVEKMESKLQAAIIASKDGDHQRRKFIEEMVHSYKIHLDILWIFFHHPKLSLLAMEIYIRRSFELHEITSVESSIFDLQEGFENENRDKDGNEKFNSNRDDNGNDSLNRIMIWNYKRSKNYPTNTWSPPLSSIPLISVNSPSSTVHSPSSFNSFVSFSQAEGDCASGNGNGNSSGGDEIKTIGYMTAVCKYNLLEVSLQNILALMERSMSGSVSPPSLHPQSYSYSSYSSSLSSSPSKSFISLSSPLSPAGIASSASASSIPLSSSSRKVVYFAIGECNLQDEDVIKQTNSLLKSKKDRLRQYNIKRITLMYLRPKSTIQAVFTFREQNDYHEDCTVRHIDPTMAYQLEFYRMTTNYEICFIYSNPSGEIQIYQGTERSPSRYQRLFVRVLIRPNQALRYFNSMSYFAPEAKRILEEMIEAIETVIASNKQLSSFVCNNLYINVLPVFFNSHKHVHGVFLSIMTQYRKKLQQLNITEAEVRMNLSESKGTPPQKYRFFLSGPTGYVLEINSFREIRMEQLKVWKLEDLNVNGNNKNENNAGNANKSNNAGNASNADENEKSHEGDDERGRGDNNANDQIAGQPYPLLAELQIKRTKVQSMGTSYVYDFPIIFKVALLQWWEMTSTIMNSNSISATSKNISSSSLSSSSSLYLASPSSTLDSLNSSSMDSILFNVQELILQNGEIAMVNREVGQNTCGMVAWLITMSTPEVPSGRQIILIANDINFEIGSFGPIEDLLFFKASQYARSLGIPRIFLSANSGAKIGMADELKPFLQVAWNNHDSPIDGFKYLYLEREDYLKLPKNCVNVESVTFNSSSGATLNENGDGRGNGREKVNTSNGIGMGGEDGKTMEHFKILDIIGIKDGLGVENLQGSGLIAGETSCAYNEIFTLSLVTCRTVGIGAYLVRLGQRTIQKEEHPIILTGVAALNNVLGKQVYSNNLQIGGPRIMYSNGISHLVVKDDLEGALEIFKWLSFVPKTINDSHSIFNFSGDDPDRLVEYYPPQNEPYDPRFLINGKRLETNGNGVNGNSSSSSTSSSTSTTSTKWISGILDKDSFIEYMAGWAKTVVCGRGRLGGIPIGIIAVETRTIELVIPADPANPDSEAQVIMQAGQVWYPDSAFKTAQMIRDCNVGEKLPLLILANWRGFSGGQKDLFDEILKFGSFIVDALREYRQPVFIYLPPWGELRGGSWVVLDSSINQNGRIEMYADPSSRGGVLEPEGIVGIKFRQSQLFSLMERLDLTCQNLSRQMRETRSEMEKSSLKEQLEKRQKSLAPIYHQIACHFADLHDKPGRMKAKKVIRDIVTWPESRSFFYHRLKRLLLEDEILTLIEREELKGEIPMLSRSESLSIIRDYCQMLSKNDKECFKYLNENKNVVLNLLKEKNDALKMEKLLFNLKRLNKENLKRIIMQFKEID